MVSSREGIGLAKSKLDQLADRFQPSANAGRAMLDDAVRRSRRAMHDAAASAAAIRSRRDVAAERERLMAVRTKPAMNAGND
jgi:hypothetical protein